MARISRATVAPLDFEHDVAVADNHGGEVPKKLEPAADEAPTLVARARGVQIYECRTKAGSSDMEWAFVAPYLTLMKEDAPQREHSLREVFNGLRWVVRSGAQWRLVPHDLPPWHTVYQQTQRWLRAGAFEAIVHDLRMLLREIEGRSPSPRAAVIDSRTLRSSPESGGRAGYDGHTRKKGSKVHMAVDTLGQLLALVVTPADEGDRARVGEL